MVGLVRVSVVVHCVPYQKYGRCEAKPKAKAEAELGLSLRLSLSPDSLSLRQSACSRRKMTCQAPQIADKECKLNNKTMYCISIATYNSIRTTLLYILRIWYNTIIFGGKYMIQYMVLLFNLHSLSAICGA